MKEIKNLDSLLGNSPFPLAVFEKSGDDFFSSRLFYHNLEWGRSFLHKLNTPIYEWLIYLTGNASESNNIINQIALNQCITSKVSNIRELKDYLINSWPIDKDVFVVSVQPLGFEEKRNEVALTAARWKALLHLLPDLIFVLDEECRFVDAYTENKGELYIAADIFLGKRVEDVLPPEIVELTRKNVSKAIQTQSMVADEYWLDIRGEKKYYEVRYVYVPQGEVMAIVRDITARKFAEAKAQLAFNIQEKILQIALKHIHLEPGDIEERLTGMLPNVGMDLNADKGLIYLPSLMPNRKEQWLKWNVISEEEELKELLDRVFEELMGTTFKNPCKFDVIELNTDELPDSRLKNILQSKQIHSGILVPLYFKSENTRPGLLGFTRSFGIARWEAFEKDMVVLLARVVENIVKHNLVFSKLLESEQKYKHLQELFRSIADNMEDMLWAKDMNKRFIFVNRAICEKLLNASDTEEPLGKTDMFFAERERSSHPENPTYHTFGEICRDSDQVVMDTGKPGRFDEFGNVKGKFLFLDVIKTPLFNEKGEMIAVVGSARDVTQEKRLEAVRNLQFEILEAATRFEGLKEFLSFVTQRMAEYFKTGNLYIARSDFEKQEFTEIAALDEKDSIESWPIKGSLSGYLLHRGKPLLLKRQEITALADKGEIAMIGSPAAVWMGSVLQVENQKLGVVVAQDYQDEDRFSDDDLRLLEALSRILGLVFFRKEQQLKLQEAFKKLKESDLLKERLLQNMSHELRTPLNGIMGFSSLLADGHVEPHLMKKYAKDIYESGARLLNLISDLLDLTTFETQDVPVEYSIFSVHELLKALLDELSKSALQKKLEINADFIKRPDVNIETDYEKLRRILWNLISNAIKFTHQGHVSIDYNVFEDKVFFRIQDTGVGIAPEHKEKIFDKFYQADMSISRGFEGAGLGLALVKILCEKLGAQIGVESQPGLGSTFELRLPAKIFENNEFSLNSDIPNPTVQGPPPRILIVEDDQMNQDFLKIFFESKGFKVECKYRGSEALDYFSQHYDFNWVFMDVKLPDIDGYTLTKRFKEINPSTHIVVVTAYATDKDRLKALEAGADLFMVKPLRIHDLNELLKKF